MKKLFLALTLLFALSFSANSFAQTEEEDNDFGCDGHVDCIQTPAEEEDEGCDPFIIWVLGMPIVICI